MEIDNNLYAESLKSALKVKFLSNSQELKLYAVSLYNASLWGREVDRRNERMRRKDNRINRW